MASLSRKANVENDQQVLDLFWFLVGVTGSSITVVNW